MPRKTKYWGCLLAAVCGIGFTVPAHTQTATTAANLPSVDSVLEKSITATGGRDAWHKLTSMQIKAEISMTPPGLTGSMTISSKAPDKQSDCTVFPADIFFCRMFDGKSGWQDDSRDGLKPLLGKDLEDMKHEADFYSDLHRQDYYSELKVSREEDFDGQKTYVVAGTRKNGTKEELYFAKDSGLMVGNKELAANEEDIKTTYFEEYKQTAGPGIWVATKIRMVSSKVTVRIDVEEVAPNADLADSMFAKPEKSARDSDGAR
jgi:hypothetical protein